jgi:excisionase family DNA binding protein
MVVAQNDIEKFVCQNDDFLTLEEASKVLKVSKWTVKRWCQHHQIPAIRVERTWRVSFQGLQRQAEANVLNIGK